MKKFLILGMAAFLVFGFTSRAAAVFTNPYEVYMANATFLAVDDLGLSGDNLVTITNYSYTPGFTLEYYYPALLNWTTVLSGIVSAMGA